MIFQWYRINKWINNNYDVLTLSIALLKIFFAVYSFGENSSVVLGDSVNLTSSFDWFTGTHINYAFRGGDNNLYIRPGWILVIGI